ncbi:ComEA family DNA-binding protein [Nocardioides sp. C4-1]|uniref:ComEA family DNA-binding protein n=1 Tax=Nocardioides sp. C4-1 TaxID=3151851 RepID=UPI003267729C
MRSRRPSPEHQDAVARRLALLSDQLASAREEEGAAVGDEWWGGHTHVSARPVLHAVTDDDGPAPPVVAPDVPQAARAPAPALLPEPGRHASRRAGAWSAALPDTLRGRVALGPGPLAVVALLVAVGLAYTCWQVVRDDPAPQAAPVNPADGLVSVAEGPPPSVPPAVPPSVPSTPSSPAPGAEAGTVTVDVAGKVRRPGIVVLDAGARVVDALEQAGGARPAVDLTSLNLARVLVDGEQILVGVDGGAAPGPPPSSGTGSGTGSGGMASPPGALVDLNLADQPALEALPQVGPVTAAAIIAWREQHGGFSAVTELLEVDGIGDKTLAVLTPLVTV